METLSKATVKKDPFDQFNNWFDEVLKSGFTEPTAMILSTSNKDGRPSSRALLLKEFSKEGFVFYTNYNSRKSKELEENPNASLLFYWDVLSRQVRIEGTTAKVDPEISDHYFDSRPKESRIGAIASPQSEVIENREFLEENVRALTKRYSEEEIIPRPKHWGGYILKPSYFEFWQGRQNRLHDRIAYSRAGDSWEIKRLAP